MNKNGYVTIETLLAGSLIIGLGAYSTVKYINHSKGLANSSISRLNVNFFNNKTKDASYLDNTQTFKDLKYKTIDDDLIERVVKMRIREIFRGEYKFELNDNYSDKNQSDLFGGGPGIHLPGKDIKAEKLSPEELDELTDTTRGENYEEKYKNANAKDKEKQVNQLYERITKRYKSNETKYPISDIAKISAYELYSQLMRNKENIVITDYNGSENIVFVPTTINEKSVIYIDRDKMFKHGSKNENKIFIQVKEINTNSKKDERQYIIKNVFGNKTYFDMNYIKKDDNTGVMKINGHKISDIDTDSFDTGIVLKINNCEYGNLSSHIDSNLFR